MKSCWVTRSTLAAELMERGIRPEKQGRNIYHPERPAWQFTVSPELADIVRKYYDSLELPLPASFAEAFRQEGGRQA